MTVAASSFRPDLNIGAAVKLLQSRGLSELLAEPNVVATSGKQADLLLLNTNPLEEAKAYNDIAVVIVNGRAINRRELSAQKLGISVNLNH